MGCNSPKTAWTITDAKTDAGKMVVRFDEPSESLQKHANFRWLEIPCGECLGCRMRYSEEWAARITEELKVQPRAMFLTLTYNNEHLPIKEVVDGKTGEIIAGNPLEPKHLELFWKKLRAWAKRNEERLGETKIRYYCAGEYGGKSMRPHYHAAIFGLSPFDLDDLRHLKNNHRGDELYTSETMEGIWGKGFVTIGHLEGASAAYIARYMLKKQKGPKAKAGYKAAALVPEFTRVSNRKGIGYDWYQEKKELVWAEDRVNLLLGGKVKKIKPPRYYEKLLEREDPSRLLEIKEARYEAAQHAQLIERERTDRNIVETRRAKEEAIRDRTRKLVRSMEQEL